MVSVISQLLAPRQNQLNVKLTTAPRPLPVSPHRDPRQHQPLAPNLTSQHHPRTARQAHTHVPVTIDHPHSLNITLSRLTMPTTPIRISLTLSTLCTAIIPTPSLTSPLIRIQHRTIPLHNQCHQTHPHLAYSSHIRIALNLPTAPQPNNTTPPTNPFHQIYLHLPTPPDHRIA